MGTNGSYGFYVGLPQGTEINHLFVLVKFSEVWRIVKFIESCGRHLALLFETTYIHSEELLCKLQ